MNIETDANGVTWVNELEFITPRDDKWKGKPIDFTILDEALTPWQYHRFMNFPTPNKKKEPGVLINMLWANGRLV